MHTVEQVYKDTDDQLYKIRTYPANINNNLTEAY